MQSHSLGTHSPYLLNKNLTKKQLRSHTPSMMKKGASKLLIVPSPGKGHLVSTVEFAKRLLDRAPHGLSITIFIIPPLFPAIPLVAATSASGSNNDDDSDGRIQYIHLPRVDPPPMNPELIQSAPVKFVSVYIEGYKSCVKEAITNLVSSSPNNSVQFVGMVVDMFCTSMIDVANEFGVPSYLFFTSNAAFLGFLYHHHNRYARDGVYFLESEGDTDSTTVPSYVNPIPTTSLPSFALTKEGYSAFMAHAKRFKETKGIFVNTFAELESHAVKYLLSDGDGETPPVYTVGPILDLAGLKRKSKVDDEADKIMNWLNEQPPSSVVLLCFGSMGSFDEPSQLREIALGLERSGHRFLWSVRRAPPKEKFAMPSDYTTHEEIMPPGFLERIGGRGMICGWVPQVEVLAHQAIGGFVSHCGWNSILESLWFGVPIVTWPMYAEQHINAFQMVRDLGLAIELTLDYRRGGGGDLVAADALERAVTCVMAGDSEVRKRVKEMGEKSRRAVTDGGSSFVSFGRLMKSMFDNMS